MIGVLLAGGAATRLPNKPLLPMIDGRPVCLSGIDYLRRHGIDHIIVVTPPNSPLVDVITAFVASPQDLHFVYQQEPTGVGDAINLARAGIDVRSMIVMADNVYPREEKFECISGVAVRKVAAWKRPHLVRANGETHLTRDASCKALYSLTTPWLIGPSKLSPEGWPSLIGQKQIICKEEGWWDIGTPELYAAYWRSK